MSRALSSVLPVVLALPVIGCVAEVGPLERTLGRLQAPERLDLGVAQVGAPREAQLVIENPGPGPVHVSGLRLSDDAEGVGHRFEVDVAEGWLRAGASMSATVRFVALADTPEVRATLEILSDTDDPDAPPLKQRAQVELTGRGVRYGLEVEPRPVDFGLVASGRSEIVQVTLRNVLDDPIFVHTPDSERGRAALWSAAGEGEFEIDAYVGPDGRMPRGRAELAPGAQMTVPARYLAPSVGLGGRPRAEWRVAGCADEACVQTVELVAETESDALLCRPEDIDFGAVFPGLVRSRSVTCINRSPSEIIVTGATLEPGSDEELSVAGLAPTTLPPGGTITLEASFAPTEQTLVGGAEVAGVMRVLVQDPATGAEGFGRVRLFGRAGGARLRITPNPLDFGEVALRTSRADELTIENIGYEAATISTIEVDTEGTGAFTADTTPLVIPRGASVTLQVRFSPRVAGTTRSGIRFVTDDAVTPEHAVGLVGIGLDLQPCMYGLEPAEVQFGTVRIGETEVREVTIRNTGPFDCLVRDLELSAEDVGFALEGPPVPPTRLTAGQALTVQVSFTPTVAGGARAELEFYISDPQNSDGRVPLMAVGRAPIEVTCPPATTTPAGQPVDLTVAVDAVLPVVSYAWDIVAAPTGGIGTPDQWQPAPPTSRTERFLPFLVGVYTLQVTVTDTEGRQASCTTDVTAEGRGLRVTLTWDGTGDVDLHVHRGITLPWFSSDDCYYANRRPIWDAAWPASDGPNPELDFDNTSARGPENTRVNVVEIGETYTIAAHNYARAQGRRATIQIFCGGGTVADATFTSRPLVGNESSNCSANDFWKVATVVFDSASTCRITPLDDYVRSELACQNY